MTRTHGMTKTPEHQAWRGIIGRCTNPRNHSWYLYGERGISVCDRWMRSFMAFYSDMGPRPSSKHSIDRIDNNGNYEPGNCRWATIEQQKSNRRNNLWVVIDGEPMISSDAARRLGISRPTLRERIKSGLIQKLPREQRPGE